MQRQHSSQATSTLGNTPNLNIGFLHQKENPTLAHQTGTTIHATPSYARVRFPTGRETTVSLRDIAPCTPDGSGILVNRAENAEAIALPDASYTCTRVCDNGEAPDDSDFTNAGDSPLAEVPSPEMPDNDSVGVRRSTRQRKSVVRKNLSKKAHGAVPYI